jgi:putative FmdB family regulatory protein
MPIYEYRCRACGAEKEVLQKISDPLLTQCPVCGKPEMVKLVSAAGFQLKGTGWYATDFKHGSRPQKSGSPEDGKAGASDAAKSDSAASGSAKADSAKPDSAKPDSAKSESAKSDSAKADSAKSEASGSASAGSSGASSSR